MSGDSNARSRGAPSGRLEPGPGRSSDSSPDRRMRILLWAEMFWPQMGGGSQFSTELARAMQKRGHELLVVTRQDDLLLPSEECLGMIPVHRFPFHQALSGGDIGRISEIRQQVAELKATFAADVIHTTSFGASMFFQLATRDISQSPLLVSLLGEGSSESAAAGTVLHRTLEAADWVTAPSHAALADTRRWVPGCSSRSSVIRSGTQRPAAEPKPFPKGDPRLLCLGRLDRVKGFDLAVSALPAILDKYPSARLVIAGDGPERGPLKKQAGRLGISRFVEFMGWVSLGDVPEVVSSASIVIMPSRADAFPLVGLQAGFMARPTVATFVGGIPELIVHGETGWLVEPGSPAALARGVERLLGDPEMMHRMRQAALRRCSDVFGFDRIVDEVEHLYAQIVSTRQPGVQEKHSAD